MKILSYLQARELLGDKLSEEQVAMCLTVSGRAEEWLARIGSVVVKGKYSTEKQLVESSGMGREILVQIPRNEWVYLVNPSMAGDDSEVVKARLVSDGKLFSQSMGEWLMSQEIGQIYQLSTKLFTEEEGRMLRVLWNKRESVVEREEVAQELWGESWSERYSDWGIDALVYRLRKKLLSKWQLVTVKGRGYMLAGSAKPTKTMSVIGQISKRERVSEIPFSIYPSEEYLDYMNDQKRVRKVYEDLFAALPKNVIKLSTKSKILCVNSYSYDNVDAIKAWIEDKKISGTKIYFAHYDPRALELHQNRIQELGLVDTFFTIYDDLRESKLMDQEFALVINDFRLNFNQNDQQNRATLKHTHRVLERGGVAIFSTVVDERYESLRYGSDQENAPLNASRPGMFQADEHLVRRCWTVPYYRKIFTKAGFSKIVEFDIEKGKRWDPPYRRWLLRSLIH